MIHEHLRMVRHPEDFSTALCRRLKCLRQLLRQVYLLLGFCTVMEPRADSIGPCMTVALGYQIVHDFRKRYVGTNFRVLEFATLYFSTNSLAGAPERRLNDVFDRSNRSACLRASQSSSKLMHDRWSSAAGCIKRSCPMAFSKIFLPKTLLALERPISSKNNIGRFEK